MFHVIDSCIYIYCFIFHYISDPLIAHFHPKIFTLQDKCITDSLQAPLKDM